jgi:hypothetical protein
MWPFKVNEEDDDICMAAAGFLFLTSKISKEKTRGVFGCGQHCVNGQC